MQKIFLVALADGRLAIIRPAYLDRARSKAETDEEFAQRALAKALVNLADKLPPVMPTVHATMEGEVPIDRTFRDAWEAPAGVISVNMLKARDIHMQRIREARDKKLESLDVPHLRAVEAGDVEEQARLTLMKQVLRDIPQTLDLNAYATPEALKAAWPVELG